MKKRVFLDCGGHHGEGLEYFIKLLGIDRDWEVRTWEPNPACLIWDRVESLNARYGLRIQASTMAVWTTVGLIGFKQEDHFVSQSGSPTDGRSRVDGWASQIAELGGVFPGLTTTIQVVSFDFSQFLEQYRHDVFEVYCKMDIEGSEFPVLRKILNDGRAGIFKHLWVEFHEGFLPAENPITKAHLLNELRKHTTVTEWQ